MWYNAHFARDLIDDMIKGAQNKTNFGCPFAVLGIDIAFTDPDIAEHYSAPLKKLRNIFASILKSSGVAEDNGS